MIVSDHIAIAATSKGLEMEGKSDEGSAHEKWDKFHADLLKLDVSEESRAIYNIECLVKIMKATAKCSESVKFEYSSKMPCRLTFEIENDSRIYYYLAPRIEQ